MRPAFAIVRQAALTPRALHTRPLLRPALTNVGCSHWATSVRRPYSAKPKPPKEPPVEIAEEMLGAEFFEEVEIDADPEWEGEEVSEGVFMSAMPVSSPFTGKLTCRQQPLRRLLGLMMRHRRRRKDPGLSTRSSI